MKTATQLLGTRFGAIEYTDEDVLSLLDGLVGFPNLRDFVLLAHKPDSPFKWLQSLDEPALAFLVVDPAGYVEGFSPELSKADTGALHLSESTAKLVLTTAAIPGGKVEEMTLNLAAPIVLNLEARIGKQVVLDSDGYNIRHRVFPQANPANGLKAA